MSANLTASVVTPVLNGAATIGDLLVALSEQVGAPRATEVIVVDNGSTDDTQTIVSRFPVTLLTETRRGPSAARNRGLRHARGEVVVFVDADVLPTRRWLAELVRPFADPGVVVAGGRTLSYLPKTPAERFMAQMPTSKLEYAFFRQHLPYVGAGNMAVRRQAALAIGGWNEELYAAEDLDFCIRLVRHYGCPILRPPDAVLFNRQRTTAEALQQQAWHHGQGLGQIHLRYPDVVRLHAGRRLAAGWILAVRSLKARIAPARQRLSLASAASAEFARYHWLWSQSFWGGFFNMVREGERRP